MMRRLFCLIALLAPLQALALNVPSLPEGMCALDVNRPAERVVFDYLQDALRGGNQLVAAFADCGELKQLDASQRQGIDHYGTILKQNTNLPLTRAQYLSTASQIVATNPNLMGDAIQQANEQSSAAIEKNNLSGAGTMSAVSQGIVYQDDKQAILAVQQTHQVNGKPVQVACVAGITLLSELPVTVNLYAPAREPNAMAHAKDLLVAYTPKLIAANP